MAIARGVKVIALTIPECEARVKMADETRRLINQGIITHKQPNFHALDLYTLIPFHSLPAADRERYWDDGLHLTADGYDWMGRHVAMGLLAMWGVARKKRGADGRYGDEGALEEEAGSPGDGISCGYVVVRKKDLG